MAVSTTSAASYNAQRVKDGVHNQVRLQGGFEHGLYGPLLLVYGPTNATIPTTSMDDAGDRRKIGYIPMNRSGSFYVLGLRVTATDMDTHATPTLTFKVQAVNAAGTKTTLAGATALTIGQGGGSAGLDAAAFGKDIGGQDLEIEIVAASATGAAGTVEVHLFGIGSRHNEA